jgi:hypothetical protein
MYYLVNVDHNGFAASITKRDWRVLVSAEDWRLYVVEWQWEEGNVRNGCKEHKDTDCEDGDSDTDW